MALLYRQHMLFSKDTSTHKIYKCVGGAENIHDEVASDVLGMLRKGWGIKSNSMTLKCVNAQNITSRNYMLVQFKKLNNMSHVCASFIHFRSSAHIYVPSLWRYAPGANGLRISDISHDWHICLRHEIICIL